MVEGRPLVLGGESFAHPRGLDGHSDADVLTHAVCDALLGALGLGDLGRWFADDDPQHRNADSLGLLAQVAERQGYWLKLPPNGKRFPLEIGNHHLLQYRKKGDGSNHHLLDNFLQH